jgi:rubrerythrin
MADAFKNTPPKPEKLGAMTEESLKAAFAGESQASQKYLAFAAKADDEGYPNIGRLFRAVAHAESMHARNHLSVLGGIAGTADNLKAAWGGETFEIDEMYPAYDAIAKLQGAASAGTSIRYAATAERDHQSIYDSTAKGLGAGNDLGGAAIRVCPVCGHTVIGDAPDECPVCGTAGQYFDTF